MTFKANLIQAHLPDRSYNWPMNAPLRTISVDALTQHESTTGFRFVHGEYVDAQRRPINVFRNGLQEPVTNLFKRNEDTADDVLQGALNLFVDPNEKTGAGLAYNASTMTLSVLNANIGNIVAGNLSNGADHGIMLNDVVPTGWTRYLNLSDGAHPFLHHEALDLYYDGTAVFRGSLEIDGAFGNGKIVFGPGGLAGSDIVTLQQFLDIGVHVFRHASASTNPWVDMTQDTTGTPLGVHIYGPGTTIDGTSTTLSASTVSINPSTLAFFGASGGPQQVVIGSRSGGVALTNLLTQLAILGLIVNNTTA